MRAFLCLPLPDPLKHALARIADDLQTSSCGVSARWVRQENYHITLRFLGDIAPNLTLDIDRLLQSIAANGVPFECQLDRVGAFPHPERARVLWVGGSASEPLQSLAHKVNRALVQLGFPGERIDPVAHVTLARLHAPPPPGLADLLLQLAPRPPLQTPVDRIVLMQSTLTSRGAAYDPLCTWTIGGRRL